MNLKAVSGPWEYTCLTDPGHQAGNWRLVSRGKAWDLWATGNQVPDYLIESSSDGPGEVEEGKGAGSCLDRAAEPQG